MLSNRLFDSRKKCSIKRSISHGFWTSLTGLINVVTSNSFTNSLRCKPLEEFCITLDPGIYGHSSINNFYTQKYV